MTKPAPPDSATVISAAVVQAHRDRRLAERALAGDVASAILWLERFGGPAWQAPKEPSRR